MMRGWIKRTLPRSLYGRAALILVLPVITLQLVVSILFIQRHFEGVTRQMTETVRQEIGYLVSEVNAAPTAPEARARIGVLVVPLGLGVVLPAEPFAHGDIRHPLDLSGRVVIKTLRATLPEIALVDLGVAARTVTLGITTRHGPMRVSFERRRVSATNPHQLLVFMVITGVLMSVVAFLFLRNQLRPIRRLARAAEAFGKGRSLPYRPSGAEEVRAAGRAFLDMRARIESQIEQRTMMLSGISHDLRTPLTRLRLEISLLEQGPETRAMAREIDEMARMIDAFLDFASGEAREELVPTCPAALLRDVLARAGPDVRCAPLPEGLRLPLRPGAVSRALQNLIDNARRYAHHVQARIEADDHMLRFVIEDDGPGIPPGRREEALRPFHRLDPARNQDQGTCVGLGLAIAADVARSHGGRLELGESPALGGLRAALALAR